MPIKAIKVLAEDPITQMTKGPRLAWAVVLEANTDQKLVVGKDCIILTKKYSRVKCSAHVLNMKSQFGRSLFMIVGPTKAAMYAAIEIYDPENADLHMSMVRKLPTV